MAPYFQYELKVVSTLLFKDCAIRKTAKKSLAKFLQENMINDSQKEIYRPKKVKY